MKTIRERAKILYHNPETYNEDIARGYESGYINGAIEQKKEDIDKACEWWTYKSKSVINYNDIDEFRKFMEFIG